jgi:hypothetical protein
VLARKATITTVCIGWRQARRESDWIRGVTFLFSQIGGAAVSVFAAPRNRVGRKEDPSILIEVLRRVSQATIKPSTGGGRRGYSRDLSVT